jgi:microsomal dipeptidase-like Zn-dependent dipeptidase
MMAVPESVTTIADAIFFSRAVVVYAHSNAAQRAHTVRYSS